MRLKLASAVAIPLIGVLVGGCVRPRHSDFLVTSLRTTPAAAFFPERGVSVSAKGVRVAYEPLDVNGAWVGYRYDQRAMDELVSGDEVALFLQGLAFRGGGMRDMGRPCRTGSEFASSACGGRYASTRSAGHLTGSS
jgi:hypothetical protein